MSVLASDCSATVPVSPLTITFHLPVIGLLYFVFRPRTELECSVKCLCIERAAQSGKTFQAEFFFCFPYAQVLCDLGLEEQSRRTYSVKKLGSRVVCFLFLIFSPFSVEVFHEYSDLACLSKVKQLSPPVFTANIFALCH